MHLYSSCLGLEFPLGSNLEICGSFNIEVFLFFYSSAFIKVECITSCENQSEIHP